MSRSFNKAAWTAAAEIRLVALALLLALGGRAAAYSCQVNPLVWPLGNQTFNLGALVAVNRGVGIVLANQRLGLRPTFCWNGTRIRSFQDCSPVSPPANLTAFNICQGQSGSVYDSTAPGAFVPLAASAWTVPDAPPVNAKSDRGKAPATFDSGQTLDIPFEVWREDFGSGTPNKSFLALGPESNVVQTLLDGGDAPSSAMGVFYGSRSVAQPTVGEIVIGGWNAAYVDPPWYNFTLNPPDLPMSIPCPIRVRLTGMTLNNAAGSFPLLAPGQSATACIDILQNQFTVTEDMYVRWVTATNHTFDNPPGTPPYNNQTYAAAKEPLIGTLDVVLDGGFSTTIPHQELVSPDRGDGPDGSYAVLNDSRIQSAVSYGPTDYGVDFGVILGGVFSAGVYMFIDYERGTVSLAKANLNPGRQDIRKVCSMNTGPVAPQPPANATGAAAPGKGQNGLDGGTVAGIVIGVLGVLVGLVAAVYQVRSHRHERRRHERELEMERLAAAAATASQNLTPAATPGAESPAIQPEANPSEGNGLEGQENTDAQL